MFLGEHSAILSTFIKLPFVIKIVVVVVVVVVFSGRCTQDLLYRNLIYFSNSDFFLSILKSMNFYETLYLLCI